jgi:hypothetical protein
LEVKIVIDKNQKITVMLAYKAMFKFLDNKYELTKSNGIGDLLGGMSLLDDGSTADAAEWLDWIEAIETASQADCDTNLHLTKS